MGAPDGEGRTARNIKAEKGFSPMFSVRPASAVLAAASMILHLETAAAHETSVASGVFTKPAVATASAQNKFDRPEAMLRWIDGYRKKPEPQRLPAAVKAMSANALFKDTETAAVYVGFIAGVLGDNPAKADVLVADMFPLPPEDQVALIRAIAYSGLPDWKGLLRRTSERMPARAVLIDRYLTDKLPTLAKLSLEESGAGLDTLWGFYYATSRREPILRMIGLLAWSAEKNNVEKLTVGSMAKWTLANNATRDVDLLRVLKAEEPRQPKTIKPALDDVIEAAETFETAKIRKQAMAALEELKTKGPQSSRNAQWWATAGTTVFALGCVAASALGQVQFGIPCVVGGPLGTAAARYFTTN